MIASSRGRVRSSLDREADDLQAYLLCVGAALGLIGFVAIALPEIFVSPAYRTLRPYLGLVGGLSAAAALVSALALLRGRRAEATIALGIVCLPSLVLAVGFQTAGAPIGASAWAIIAVLSAYLGIARSTGRAGSWPAMVVLGGLLAAGNGMLMLLLPGLFAREVYGALVDLLVPLGVTLTVSGVGIFAAALMRRRNAGPVATAIAVAGLIALNAGFVDSGLYFGLSLWWPVAVFLGVTVLGPATVQRIAVVQLALLGVLALVLADWRLPAASGTAWTSMSLHVAVAALACGKVLWESGNSAIWLSRLLSGGSLVIALSLVRGPSATAPAGILSLIDLPAVVSLLAAITLARSVLPSAGVLVATGAAAATIAVAVSAVSLFLGAIGQGPAERIGLRLPLDHTVMLLGLGTSFGLFAWSHAIDAPIQPRLYAGVGSGFVVLMFAALVGSRGLDLALVTPGPEGQVIVSVVNRIRVLLLAFAGSALLGTVALVSWQIVRPLKDMSEAAARRVRGFDAPFGDQGRTDEIGALGRALDDASLAQRQSEAATAAAMEIVGATKAANKAKSEFLSNISHELRTPLNSIIGFNALLREQLGSGVTPKQERYLTNVRTSANQLLRMIDDILDLARIESGRIEMHPEDVGSRELFEPIIEDARRMATAAGLGFVADQPPPRPLRADPRRLRQILMNLLSNAIKFTPTGRVGLVVAFDGSDLLFTVKDTGVGIARDKHSRLFGKFERLGTEGSTTPGTGLGLAVTKQLVDLHHGTISFESDLGKGSTFIVRLPGLVVTPRESDSAEPTSSADLHPATAGADPS